MSNRQLKSVETLIHSACTRSPGMIFEQRFNFHLSPFHPPLHPPISAPLHPKMLFLSPSRQNPKWALMTPCKQCVTEDKLLEHFPLFAALSSASGESWKVSEVAGVLPVLWLLSLSPSAMSRCRDPITTHVRVDFSSLQKGTARVFREGGSGFANGVRLTSVSGEEEGGPARVLHTWLLVGKTSPIGSMQKKDATCFATASNS